MELSVKAQAEVKRTRRRTTRSLDKRMAMGVPMGSCPAGWLDERDKRGRAVIKIDGKPIVWIKKKPFVEVDGELIPADDVQGQRVSQWRDPEYAPVIEECTKRVGEGHPFSVIAEDLTRRGVLTPSDYRRKMNGEKVPDPKPWRGLTVRRLAENIRNIGKCVRNGEVVTGQWEAIVTEDQWNNAQLVVRDSERVAKHTPKRTVPGRVVHLLKPECGVCGAERRMSGRSGDGEGDDATRFIYACRAGKGCARKIDGAALINYVITTVAEYLSDPEVFGNLNQRDDAAMMAALSDYQRAERDLEELFAAQEAGGPDAPSWRLVAVEEKRLKGLMDEAQKRMNALTVPEPVRQVMGVSESAVTVADWLTSEKTPVAARRAAIDALVSIRVGKGIKGPAAASPAAIAARVTIVPRCPSGCGTAMDNTPAGWQCTTCKPVKQAPTKAA